jgi:NAD(P)-dependent dehydrogenase (short-subunit alcohol dehydrogenase family)
MAKVALITGASRGIGKATALAFARAGFDVAITARTETEGQISQYGLTTADGKALPGSLATTVAALTDTGARALAIPMDLLDPASVTAAAERVLQTFGRVDVLINNAVYQGRDINATFLKLDDGALQRVCEGYILAPYRLTRRILESMLAAGGGTIINVSSGAGETDPPIAADKGGWGFGYGAGKAAFSRMAGVIATEFGHRGIRAFTINPGVVRTEALKATIGDQGLLAIQNGSAPPEVPAELMLWLATSPEADALQRRTIQAQEAALQYRVVADWRKQA